MPNLSALEIILIIYVIVLILGLVGLIIYLYRLIDRRKKSDNEIASLSKQKESLANQIRQLIDEKKSGSKITLEGFFENLNDCYLIINPSYSIVYLNKNAKGLLNLDDKQSLLKSCTEIIAFENSDLSCEKFFDKVKVDKTASFPKWTFIKTDNKQIPITGSASIYKTPAGIQKIIIQLQDAENEYNSQKQINDEITHVKNDLNLTQTQLTDETKLSQQSKILQKQLHVSVIEVDKDNKIIYLNQQAVNSVGVTEENAKGQKINDIFKFIDANEKPIYDFITKALSDQFCSLPRWTYMLKLGKKTPLHGFAVKSDNKTNPSARIYFWDGSIDHDEEQTTKLFISGLAHDLKSPLTTVRGVAELMLSDYEILDQKERTNLLEGVKNSSLMLINLVNDLLNYSRLEQGRIMIKKESFDITKLTNEIIDRMKIQAKEKKLYISYVHEESNIPKVYADKSKTQEILVNLVSNAIKYTQQGGIKIKHQIKDESVRTIVEDTGQGIDEKNKKILFKKFYQIGSSRQLSASKSTGLGLYISKEFADLMGGDLILIKSEVEKGSVFSLSLPIAPN